MSRKKTPLRKCVVTNEMKPKKELIRVVRTPDGEIVHDPSGKKSGRGAYLTASKSVMEEAKKKKILSRHLKADVKEEFYDNLIKEIPEDHS
ncbi:RNase P modulator RnpM [Alteribacter natronophilus]|uniref:RNase P modulator RnpM n=1 Tax=Alteribacter natronophilus TaxID=2583810 RepID=UPI00110E3CDA|nr:YlxR family protein [Alteribacter natronophilus]TMW73246.1 YlxR family protein [Alteribacter natronophilus]